MAEQDSISMMTKTIISGVVGVIILCSFAIPTIYDQIAGITNETALAEYGDLLKMVIMFLIVGLILMIVRSYNSAGR